MKGFKKDGKFRPTSKKSISSLKKSDLSKTRYKDSLANTTVLPNQVLKVQKEGFELSVVKDPFIKGTFAVAIFDDRLTTPRNDVGTAPSVNKEKLSQDKVDELHRMFNNDPEGTYHNFKAY